MERYYNLKYFTGEQVLQLEEQIKQQLFKVPDEEEIEKEMLEMDKLKKIDQDYQEKKRELQQMKAKINISKIQKIENEQKRLAQKLEQLINEPAENEQEEMLKLVALKRRVAEAQKQEVKLLEEQYLKKKELEIQEKVRKRIELEKILEKKKELNEQFKQVKNQLEMIEEEQNSRKNEMKKYLEKALKHDILNTNNENEKDQIKDLLVEQMVADQKDKENILSEVQAIRQQEKNKIKFEFQKKLRELNEQRFQLNEEGEKILIKKAQHYELQKKGIDFLSNLEQGFAPPKEFIFKNMQDFNEDEYRNEFNVEEITNRAKKFSRIGKQRIEYLKSEYKDIYGYDPFDRPYKGELKPVIQRLNPENVYICRLIIDWLIENAIRQYLEKQNIFEATKEKQQYLQEKAKRLQDKMNQAANQINYISIRDRIFEKVFNKVIREAAVEIATVNQMAKTISLNLITRAIKGQRNTTNSEAQLSKIFYSLRKADMTKKGDDNFRFNFQDSQQPNSSKVQKKPPPTAKDQKKKNQDDQVDEQEKYKQDEDKTILKLFPDTDCINQLGTETIIQIENEYWKNVSLENQNFIPHNSKNKYFTSALTLSFNKEFLAVGYTNGLVQVYNTLNGQLIAIVEQNQQKPIVQLQFAFDNISQLMALDQDGNLTVNYNGTNLKLNKQSKQKEEVQSLSLLLYYDLNWKYITRAGKPNVQDELKIVQCYFHPGITFTGVQPSIILGCENGLIMKYNSNKDLYQNQIYRFPIHNIVNFHIITNQDADFPQENQNLIDAKDNYNANNQKPLNIFREFFIEHKAKILLIVFINKPETFISIDSKGLIYYWVYEKEQFNVRQNGYQPKQKFKVVTESIFYVQKEKNGKDNQEEIKKKIELATNKMSKEQGGKEYFKQLIKENPSYQNDLVQLITLPNLNKIFDIVITKEQFPTEADQDVIFYTGRVNFKEERFDSLYEEKYKSLKIEGYIHKCQAVNGNKYIYIQQIYPHKIDTEIINIQFIRFDTTLFKLKKVKTSFESPIMDGVDFTVIENFGAFGVPYLFVLLKQAICVVSCATGSKLLEFSKHLTNITQEAKLSSQVECNMIRNLFDSTLFLCTNETNGIYKYQIIDNNDDEQKQDIANKSIEFKRLYSI